MSIDDDRALRMYAMARRDEQEAATVAMMDEGKYMLEEGKYTFYLSDTGTLLCDRYHLKEWREFLDDKAVHALFDEVMRLREENRRLAKWPLACTGRHGSQSPCLPDKP